MHASHMNCDVQLAQDQPPHAICADDRRVNLLRRRAASSALLEHLESDVSTTECVDAFEGVTIDQVRSVLEHAARSALAPRVVRVLFDQGTPKPLPRSLQGHAIDTAYAKGWSTLDLSNRRLAIVVLCTTRLSRIRLATSLIQAAIDQAAAGSYVEVDIP